MRDRTRTVGRVGSWWRVVALTSELDDVTLEWIPVVRHELYGRTRAEALAVFRAHKSADAFLRSCTDGTRFGDVRCMTRVRVERTDPPRF